MSSASSVTRLQSGRQLDVGRTGLAHESPLTRKLGAIGRLPAATRSDACDVRRAARRARGLAVRLNLTSTTPSHAIGAAARRRASAGTPVMLSAMTVSYPRRQQVRRVLRAAKLVTGAMIALIGAVLLASAGHAGLALSLGAAAVVLALLSRRALRLARRSGVGADSEAEVRRALEPLARQGWRVAARGRLAGSRGPGSRAVLSVGDGFRDRDQDAALQPGAPRANDRRGTLAGEQTPALSVRGAARRVRDPRADGRAVRGGSARCVARPPDTRAAPDTPPPSAITVAAPIARAREGYHRPAPRG
jgi:hypothetical protein